MKTILAIIISLMLTFGLHWLVAKMCNTTLKEFYKFYSADEFTSSYLAIFSLCGFMVFLLFVLAII
jgi:hypothetical protein